jgi:hypothetical protein
MRCRSDLAVSTECLCAIERIAEILLCRFLYLNRKRRPTHISVIDVLVAETVAPIVAMQADRGS